MDIDFKHIYNMFIGGMVSLIHIFIVYASFFIILLTDNLFILYSMSFVLLIILAINHVYGDCPITTIEEDHLGFSSIDLGNSFSPIKYDKTRRPEITLQWIFLSLIIVLSKILIVFLKYILKDINVNIIIN